LKEEKRMIARIIPIEGPDGEVDPDYGVEGRPPHIGGGPIVLPPLPGIWPPPGKPNFPVHPWLPGHGQGSGHFPIFITPPDNGTLPVPPGNIWPPLPPDSGIAGKVAILILVVGVGYRWFIYEAPAAQPK
jgi:hypothetical protein